jgi:ATP-dependent Clp protease ATP-binding subunit ClpA
VSLVASTAEAETWLVSDVIGRDAELQAVDTFLDDTSDGLAILVLEGEAGIGKTTIWSEAAARAAAVGFAIVRSRPAAVGAR